MAKTQKRESEAPMLGRSSTAIDDDRRDESIQLFTLSRNETDADTTHVTAKITRVSGKRLRAPLPLHPSWPAEKESDEPKQIERMFFSTSITDSK